jgi:hypothetical protein
MIVIQDVKKFFTKNFLTAYSSTKTYFDDRIFHLPL